jgi:metallo-beta-lactamase class B
MKITLELAATIELHSKHRTTTNKTDREVTMQGLTTAACAALCALSLSAPDAGAQTVKDFLAQVTAKWSAPFEPFHLIDNIYYVGTDGIAAYVIKTSDGLILMDTAIPQLTGMLKDNIAKLGFKEADIRYILNTHAHYDHTGGFAEIKQDTGAKLIAGARDKPLLEAGYYPGEEKNTDFGFPPVTVDRAVTEGDKITLGNTTLTAHATPGHTPGCTSWEMTVKDGEQNREVLFFCSGTVALNRLVGNPTYPGIVDDYRTTYAKVKPMKIDVLLGPHPEVYNMQAKRAAMKDGAPNPFVEPGELAAYAATLEQQFDE